MTIGRSPSRYLAIALMMVGAACGNANSSPDPSTTEPDRLNSSTTSTLATTTTAPAPDSTTSPSTTTPPPSQPTTMPPAPEPEATVVVSEDVPDRDMIDIHTGATVNLRSVVKGDKPLLFWFWSPL